MTPEEVLAVQGRAQCLYDLQQVEAAIDRLAQDISARLIDSNPVLLCIMNGGLILSGSLAVRLNFPLQIDYLHATRYRGATTGANLHWKAYPSLPLKGRTVLVVDDILDEGATLKCIIDYCHAEGAEKVLSAVLIDKIHSRKVAEGLADFAGLTADDRYLYGFGMDYKGYLRNAPGIYAIDPVDM